MTSLATVAEHAAPFRRPPHVRSPRGEVGVWYTEPAGVLVQFVEPARGTEALVRWLVGPAANLLFQRFRTETLAFLFDLTRMTRRDLAARALLLQMAPGFRHRFHHVAVVPPKGTGAFVTNTLYAGAALLRTAGVPIEVAPTLGAALARCPLRCA